MNIYFEASTPIVSFVKESFLLALNAQHKKILTIAFIAFSFLGACYLLTHYCSTTPNNMNSDIDELQDYLFDLEEIVEREQKNNALNFDVIYVGIAALGGSEAIQKLHEMRIQENWIKTAKRCHFGVCGFFNFEIAVATQADKIILFDGNANMVHFNKEARELLKSCSDASEFKEKLIKKCESDEILNQCRFYGRPFAKAHEKNSVKIDKFISLSNILNDDQAFLSKEENFQYLKKMATEGHIHIFQGDFTDTNIIKKIVQTTHAEGYTFHTIYISNLFDWIRKDKKEKFSRNMRQIGEEDNPLIVEGIPPYHVDDIKLNIVYYRDPQSNHLYDPMILRDNKDEKALKEYYPSAHI